MPTYLWTGKTPSGQEAVERVTADTPEAARKILEEHGWTDLRQHTTEIHNFAGQQVASSTNPDYHPKLTPQQELAFIKGTAPGLWQNWLKSLRESITTIFILTACLAWAIYRQRTLFIVTSCVLLGVVVFLFPVLHLWFSQTKNAFHKLHKARNWRRWDEVLKCLDQMQNAQRSTKIGIGEAEMARYRALALAGLGRVDEAVKGFNAAAEKSNMPRWLCHVHLATIYSVAKQYDQGLEMYRLALDEATDKSVVWIDMGIYLVERFHRVDEAKQLLAKAETAQLSELARNYLPNLRGKIAYHEKDYAAAEGHMRQTLAGYEKQPPTKHYIFEPAILICKGYLAASCAAQGKKDEARKLFAVSGEYLSVVCLDELVTQYHAFMRE